MSEEWSTAAPSQRWQHGQLHSSMPVLVFLSQAELARQARDARMAEVEAENEALKQALQRLEATAAALQGSGGNAAGGAAGQGGASPSAAAAGSMRVAQLEGEANVLRRKVAELQKGIERLQQVRAGCQDKQAGPCSTPVALAGAVACGTSLLAAGHTCRTLSCVCLDPAHCRCSTSRSRCSERPCTCCLATAWKWPATQG